MNWEAMGAIGEMIAAAAVVVTLIYLSTQIRQNNKLLSSESRQALVANDVTSLMANITNADVFAKLTSNVPLSAEDQLRLNFMFSLDLRNREFEYFQFTNGMLDEETWLSYRKVVLINHASGMGRKWWNKIGRNIVDPKLTEQIDELLQSEDIDISYEKMSKWADE